MNTLEIIGMVIFIYALLFGASLVLALVAAQSNITSKRFKRLVTPFYIIGFVWVVDLCHWIKSLKK